MLRIDTIRRWPARLGIAVVAAVFGLQGCDTGVLEVNDPDIVLEANSAAAARALRNGVFLRLSQAVNGIQGPDALFVFSGLLTDEWRSGDTFVQRNNQDQRIFQPENTFNAGPNRSLNRIRTEAQRALTAFRTYLPDSTSAIASMFAVTAYAEVLMAEFYCNGTPLSDLQGTSIVYGDPLTNDSLFQLAASNADSALAQLARSPAFDSLTVRKWDRLVRIVKGRALVDRARTPADFAAAAAVVTSVPTTYKFYAYHALNSSTNQVWALNNSARRYTLTNSREGGVGIDFVTPNDPRLPRYLGGGSVFDNSIPMTLVRQALWGQFDSIPIATGIEARLIEAEALLQAGNNLGWLTAINTLRTTAALYPPIAGGAEFATVVRGANLTALADSGARNTDVHFRERAFWMFSTGHRLGDLRRLLRQYGRTEAQTYPNGAFVKGGSYGDAIQMPVPFDETNNPSFTGCLDRNP